MKKIVINNENMSAKLKKELKEYVNRECKSKERVREEIKTLIEVLVKF